MVYCDTRYNTSEFSYTHGLFLQAAQCALKLKLFFSFLGGLSFELDHALRRAVELLLEDAKVSVGGSHRTAAPKHSSSI